MCCWIDKGFRGRMLAPSICTYVYWLSGLRTLGLHLYGAWDNGINVEGTHEGFWSWSRHSYLVICLAQTQADQTNTTNTSDFHDQ